MGSRGRDLVKMTDSEIEEFLAATLKVQVATINPDGSPHLTTLFHVVEEGRIAFWTYARSQKIKNIQRDPRVTCLVETGDDYFELRGVSLSGRAELVTDEAEIRRIGTAVAARMSGGADIGDVGREQVERQVRKRVGVVVVPTKTASWDHRKMLTAAGP